MDVGIAGGSLPPAEKYGVLPAFRLVEVAPQQYVNAEKPAVPRLVTARQIVLDKDTLNGYMQKVPLCGYRTVDSFC